MSKAVRARRHEGYVERQRERQEAQAALEAQRRRRVLHGSLIWAAVLVVVALVITSALVSAKPTSDDASGSAPGFTLADTAGERVSLAAMRGSPVLLYFNEGAGCDACFYQMVDIEKNRKAFDAVGVKVLPIAANPLPALSQELKRFGLETPWLSDTDVKVSTAYGVVGKGMHAGLPGHSFVLIDENGDKRWYGEYPTMFLPSADLITEVKKRLA